EQSVRYHEELWPAEAQPPELSRRAAAHLETAGVAAHDRGDDLAAVNLLDRAAVLLPGDDPALARLDTVLGAALGRAGELERARTTLEDAQRIALASHDERQHAHARVQALLLVLEVDLADAATEINRALPGLRRVFERSRDERGFCQTLLLEAALHWDHARSAAAEDAWRHAADYARRVNDRGELADIL